MLLLNFNQLKIIMKRTKKILFLALIGLFFTACKDANSSQNQDITENNTQTEVVAENLQTASFTIEGMHCEFGCAKTIEKKLAKMEGVKSAKVDFESKKAEVVYDATLQTPQVLRQTVEAMADGKTYTVSKITSSSDQSSLYLDQEQKKKKEKKTKKSKSSTPEAKTESSQPAEKKGGCCSGKSSCSSKSKTGSL